MPIPVPRRVESSVQRSSALAAVPAAPTRCTVEVGLARIREQVHGTVLSVAGGYDMGILVAAERVGYRLIAARSESGAAFAAAALAWETGRPALLVVITSPGVYGTLQALHYAYVSRVPLLLLSGESSLAGSTQCGDGVGGPSVTRVTAALTAWSADIARADELANALVRAAGIAAAESRPVHLNVPTHVAARQVSW